MCRFIAYRGKPVLLDDVLYKPKNSLIRQSAKAHEAEEPLNGDGFGVGWYTPDYDQEPGLFVSVRPAWNDRNLRSLSKHILTPCLFAHVRAASEGEVSEANCHPFQYKNFLFMHNGGVGGFQLLKRKVRRLLSDEIYDWVRGQTDSEHFFALILENLRSRDEGTTAKQMAEALELTIWQIEQMKKEAGITEVSYINCVMTNGDAMIAVRYVSDPTEQASTLYYSEGNRYECHDGVCMMVEGGDEQSVLIVSERLTWKAHDWKEILTNHICVVDEKRHVYLTPIDDGVHVRAENAASVCATAVKAGGFVPKKFG